MGKQRGSYKGRHVRDVSGVVFKEKAAGEKSLEEVVVDLLAERKLHVTTAESCTGGLIAGTLVNVAGASDVLNEGYVTYSNEAKERLIHVSHETLELTVP